MDFDPYGLQSKVVGSPLQGKLLVSNDAEAKPSNAVNLYYLRTDGDLPMTILNDSIAGVKPIFTIGESGSGDDEIFYVSQYFSKIYIRISGITTYPSNTVDINARFTLEGKNVVDGETSFSDVDDFGFTLGPPNQKPLAVVKDGAQNGVPERVAITGGYVLSDVYEGDQIRIRYENFGTVDTSEQQYIFEFTGFT